MEFPADIFKKKIEIGKAAAAAQIVLPMRGRTPRDKGGHKESMSSPLVVVCSSKEYFLAFSPGQAQAPSGALRRGS